MKVTRNQPPPVVQPPEIYDITGLTRTEFYHIRGLLAINADRHAQDNGGDRGINNLSQQIWNVLFEATATAHRF